MGAGRSDIAGFLSQVVLAFASFLHGNTGKGPQVSRRLPYSEVNKKSRAKPPSRKEEKKGRKEEKKRRRDDQIMKDSLILLATWRLCARLSSRL
jgi:hypothetical protein